MEQKKAAQTETVINIPLSELHSFPNQPFKVRDDEGMQEMVESVKKSGVLIHAIVHPRSESSYEIIAGHRRKRACELAEQIQTFFNSQNYFIHFLAPFLVCF